MGFVEEDGPGVGAPRVGETGEVRFALLGHPTVQLLRFGTKAGIVWALTLEEMGLAMLAGLFVFLGQHAALLGMDDAVVQAPRLSRGLWRKACSFTNRVGIAMAVLVVAAGAIAGPLTGERELLLLTAVLAPTVWIGNLGVLPTALLLRAHAFRRVFLVDVAGAVAFALVTILLAALGAGEWCLVGGWYANALASLVSARTLAREERAALRAQDEEQDEVAERAALRFGAEVSGASLLSFGGARGDGFAVGLGLGSAALGLYDWALHLAQFGLGYATSLAERCLFPILSEERRTNGLGRAHRAAFRLTAFGLLPAHVLLALLAEPIVETFFPARWHGAAPIVALLALAAGARCFEIVADTTLKAAGRGGAVWKLSAVRLFVLVVALLATLPSGTGRVAAGVLVARVIGAALSTGVAARELRVLAGEARVA